VERGKWLGWRNEVRFGWSGGGDSGSAEWRSTGGVAEVAWVAQWGAARFQVKRLE
jgi:hypothetical protein